jgi:hypothetical protein
MRVARDRESEARVESEELADAEVPAAVVCAHCGNADCPGCLHELTRSGVVSVVPWERPGTTAFARLWATARATTFDAERFFEALPEGPLAPAVRFAVVSETIAAAAMGVGALVPLALIAPVWVEHMFLHQTATLARFATVGIVGLAGLLVAAHAAHGWALDYGARRSGARGATGRALRFGLYAAGWDLVIGPLGVAIVAVREGGRAAVSVAGVGVGLPGRSARAFLRGCYGLEGRAAGPAMRASWIAAAVATTFGAFAVIAAFFAAVLS